MDCGSAASAVHEGPKIRAAFLNMSGAFHPDPPLFKKDWPEAFPPLSLIPMPRLMTITLLIASTTLVFAEEAVTGEGGPATPAPSSAPPAIVIPAGASGAEVFTVVCATCHGKNGEGILELKSPSIAALPDWYITAQVKKFQADMRGADPKDVTGAQMRAVAHVLPAETIEAVAAHVAGLKRIPTKNTLGGVAENGKEFYKIYCEACHRPRAGGDLVFHSPPLIGLQDWYLAAQLEKFRKRVRGGHPNDVDGAKMQVPSGRFLNEQEEKDLLAYIAYLANKD